ncbi:MAG TPA: BLUF domain-containing protein [Sphingobium sp.]|uniref:BLUF domain-containing protein n=1 Tax=Sphingobium sp. TaxID=1912891 RepID=UPI002ED45D0F
MVYQLSFVATHEDVDTMSAAEQLNRLYEAAHAFERQDLTGLMLRHDSRLLYCMEGEEETVVAQYETVKGHPRVKGVAILRQREMEIRNFRRWSFALDDDPRENVARSLEDRVVALLHHAPPEIRQIFLAFAKLSVGSRVA